ncbi:MAG: glycosyltransferase family 4 protein, partial [Candidatus Saccharimonadales bacterium]
MKIAMMVRGFLQTPVPNDIAYSPATVAKSIAEGLTRAGHEVTFFGPEGTNLAVTAIETCSLRPLAKNQQEVDELVGTSDLFQDYLPALYDAKMARKMLQDAKAGQYDCVIFNHFESALALASLFPTVPVVHLLHDFIDEERRNIIEAHMSPNQHFISISDSQRRDAPDLPYIATIYNGIDTDKFEYNEDAEDYLMYSGRITPAKGVKEAVQVAVQSNRRLLIAGSLSKSDYWYFDEYIKPYLNDKILYLGMLDREQMVKYYKMASALLMPIQWQEPFGLSMAEANACGTPVIAFRRGSVPEVILDKKTGFIVDNSAEMIMAINKIDTIKRRACRDHVEKKFTEAI